MFQNQTELKEYYDKKYSEGGYINGFGVKGFNISDFYHYHRHNSVNKLLKLNENDSLLDLGCGNGNFLMSLTDKCSNLYGVDISEIAFKDCNHTTINFKQGNIEELDYQNDSFTKVTCIEVLEHVINPEKVIAEIYRILKPMGLAIISYPIYNHTILKKVERLFFKENWVKIDEHLTEWDIETLFFKFNRFKVLEYEGIVVDLGFIERLKNISKWFAINISKVQVLQTNFLFNSKFATISFQKL